MKFSSRVVDGETKGSRKEAESFYVRLGKTGRGVLAVILGLIATTITILIKWNWNKPWGSLGSLALGTLFLICMWQTAKQMQDKAIEEHIARGEQLGSRSTVFGVGIATLALWPSRLALFFTYISIAKL